MAICTCDHGNNMISTSCGLLRIDITSLAPLAGMRIHFQASRDLESSILPSTTNFFAQLPVLPSFLSSASPISPLHLFLSQSRTSRKSSRAPQSTDPGTGYSLRFTCESGLSFCHCLSWQRLSVPPKVSSKQSRWMFRRFCDARCLCGGEEKWVGDFGDCVTG
ncbi:hypothetical protein BDV96DRAFT_584807 [Lophiotrema nucula]|uniref:Uncharacterized protein n=1 Tax=Lophiotrema nucula TaxID=690887 RepID=A0A6A5YT53_9PLEO|nr:hypothetical protein BDV96DRAFT_584807 [Lophiotrema nucula]